MVRGLDGFFDSLVALCGFEGHREGGISRQFPVVMARGKHLFPFRTEQLSPSAPMVLGPQGPGRVGRRRFNQQRAAQTGGSFSLRSEPPRRRRSDRCGPRRYARPRCLQAPVRPAPVSAAPACGVLGRPLWARGAHVEDPGGFNRAGSAPQCRSRRRNGARSGGAGRGVVAFRGMEGALETERLRLSPLTEADLDDLVDLDLEPEVRKFIDPQGIILPVDRNELRTYEWERHVSPGGFYGARERVGNAFVGFFQLEAAPDRDGEVELGYRLRRHAWGLGYATEGARALIAHAFDVLGYRRVYAHSLNDNPASIRVMEKVGLVPAAPWSYRGMPGVEYAIERDGPARSEG